ncbi:chemotaxis protein CheC [Evansella caseinilytica]|uniref:Chemotaxis protein CheC n=1 Tax=Evansella caseinilytica TaxID=1503961 RepID=A0A1H3M3E4_9BACI|nr:chemotaxis protein CheC [Evansella caseinilytica]SDY71242.1 chemotaxis protein CheC [Evansella caseinilytica]
MSYLERIKPQHLDILKELGNIGAGHAATALSRLLNKAIDMTVPSVQVVPFSEISSYVGGEDAVVAAVMLRIEGDAPGNMFFMLPVTEASRLIQLLTGDSTVDFLSEEVNDMGFSALNEMGNILAGSYLAAFSDFTSLNLQPSPPALAIDMPMAILSYGLLELSMVGEAAIFIDTQINEKDALQTEQTKGHFFLLPDPDSFEIILNSLGVTIDE